MSTPTQPNASTDLSGGTGITKKDLVTKVLRRVDDNPFTDVIGVVMNNTDVNTTITGIPADCTTKYQVGGQIDFVDDGTFETCLITAIPSTTSVTVRRGHRQTTVSAHANAAVFRYQGRWMPNVVSEVIDDTILDLWPNLYDVRHVDWTLSATATPELWYVLPADTERAVELYQRSNSTPTDLRVPLAWGGPHFLDSNFLDGGAGSDVRGLQVYGVSISTPDLKLHGLYLARILLTNLTAAQIGIIVYRVAGVLMETGMAGESKPDRRPILSDVPAAANVYNVFLAQAAQMERKEMERLMEYLPRRNRRKFRGARHYSENHWGVDHPVRPY